MNDIIWVFREPRSGGTWFSQQLCNVFNRSFYFLELLFQNKTYAEKEQITHSRKQELADTSRILNTHYFSALKSMHNYVDPILFFVTRKNKVEQFLSEQLVKYTNTFNILHQGGRDALPEVERTIAPIKDALLFVEKSKKQQQLWEQYATKYRHEIVYYEDLINVFSSDILPIRDWSMNKYPITVKLPYDKKEIFLNYDSICNLITEAFETVN